MLHLDAHAELFGQHFDKHAEVHALVGGVVEDGFGVVALELHVVHLHVQSKVGHDAAGAQQGGAFLLEGVGPAVDVGFLGAAEELADALAFGVDAVFAHLQAAEFAGEADDAHVVAGLAFDGHNVALGDLQAVGQTVEVLVVVLEAHLDAVEGPVGRLADAGHPVGRRHLRAALALTAADGLVAFGLVVAATAEEDRLFVFHPRNVRVGVHVGVQLALLAVVFLHLGVLAFDVFLLLLGLAAVFHEVGHVFCRGHGLLVVYHDVGGQLVVYGLLRDVLFGNSVLIIFFFHCFSFRYLFFRALLMRNESSIKAILA